MIIAELMITVVATLVALGITGYAAYLTDIVSGYKLLEIDSHKGYIYATTYKNWQFYALIAISVAVILWILFVLLILRRHRRKKKEKANV
ncbi:MAG: hypothetical protein IIT48_05305 [Lachnospiraceae bacterium]|nr:hypothetical protein [Lachnospiraceae bacterium]